MMMRELGRSGLYVAPLALGGNVFGWTADESTSFSILDAFVEAGFNLIDTANVYSRWVPGNCGGESETIIGKWLRRRPGVRSKVILATKVGADDGSGGGLARSYIRQEVERSLVRLDSDYIDLYQSHIDDPHTTVADVLETYADLMREGKVRAIGASAYAASRVRVALQVSASHGFPRYESLQPGYSLYDRSSFEGDLADLCQTEGLGVISHSSLARGFLTGKYRGEADLTKSPRGAFLNKLPHTVNIFAARGQRILAALDEVSRKTGATPAQLSLAWLLAHGVTAPIASATSVAQLHELLAGATLELPPAALGVLDEASANLGRAA